MDLLRTKRPRHVDVLRTKKTAPAGVGAVVMGPFRGLRIKRPRHVEIKDEKDRARWRLRIIMTRASWSETGADGSL